MKVQKANFNLRLFRHVYLASVFAAFIGFVCVDYGKAQLVLSWFSDRDAILTWCEGTALAVYDSHLASLCYRKRVKEPRVHFGDPSKRMFYDEFIRVPDYYAGPLSSLNIEPNTNIESGTENDGPPSTVASSITYSSAIPVLPSFG